MSLCWNETFSLISRLRLFQHELIVSEEVVILILWTEETSGYFISINPQWLVECQHKMTAIKSDNLFLIISGTRRRGNWLFVDSQLQAALTDTLKRTCKNSHACAVSTLGVGPNKLDDCLPPWLAGFLKWQANRCFDCNRIRHLWITVSTLMQSISLSRFHVKACHTLRDNHIFLYHVCQLIFIISLIPYSSQLVALSSTNLQTPKLPTYIYRPEALVILPTLHSQAPCDNIGGFCFRQTGPWSSNTPALKPSISKLPIPPPSWYNGYALVGHWKLDFRFELDPQPHRFIKDATSFYSYTQFLLPFS